MHSTIDQLVRKETPKRDSAWEFLFERLELLAERASRELTE